MTPLEEAFPVHPSILGLLAIDRLQGREREAAEARLAASARAPRRDVDRPAPPRTPLRRVLARSAAGLSRVSRDIALRLDETLESDLSRSSLS